MASTRQDSKELFAPPSKEELESTLFAPPPATPVASKVETKEATLFAPPPDSNSPEYKAVQKISSRGTFEAPLTGTEVTTDKELEAIARKHGVSSDALKRLSSFYGARREEEEVGKYLAGAASRSAGFGIPQWLVKKSQDDLNFRRALDDVRELADAKRSLAEAGAEMLLPGGAVAAIGKGIRGFAKAGAVAGSVYGTTGSREGQEVLGATLGAGVGGVLGAGIGKLVTRDATPKVAKGLEEIAVEYSPKNQQRVEEGAQVIYEKRRPAEEEIVRLSSATGADETSVPTQEVARKIVGEVDRNTPEGTILVEAAARAGTTPEQYLARQVISERVLEIARRLSGDDSISSMPAARKALLEGSGEGGEDYLRTISRDIGKEKARLDYISGAEVKAAPQNLKFVRTTSNLFSDPYFVLRTTDDIRGTNILPDFNRLQSAYNRYTFARKPYKQKLEEIYRLARQSNADSQEMRSKIFDAINSGTARAELPPEHYNIAQEYKKLFVDALEAFNKVSDRPADVSALNLVKREDYIPNMTKEPADFISAVERKHDDILSKIGVDSLSKIPEEDFARLRSTSKEFNDFLRGLELMDNRKITSPVGASNKYVEILSSSASRPKMESVANAVHARKDAIPDFLLEKDIFRLYDRYITQTLRHQYLRESLDKLRSHERVLRKLGDDIAADYLSRLTIDAVGVRPGTAARGNTELKIQLARILDKKADAVGGITGEAIRNAKYLPDILEALGRNIYENQLGAALRTVTQNMTQPLVKTAPELGGVYGYETIAKATMDAASNWKSLARRLETMGLTPENFTAEGQNALARGIMSTALYRVPATMLKSLSKVAMYLYTKTDMANRIITLAASDRLAADLAGGKGHAAATKALSDMPPSIQREALAALSRGDQEELRTVLAQHLVSSTQYHYNRLAMSEYGRTMGPLFSTFSKWPLATFGDVVSDLHTKGFLGSLSRLTEKYMIPWMLLSTFGYFIHGPVEDMSDRQKKIFGSQGLSSAAPIGSLVSMAKGDFFTPPMVDVIWGGVVRPALDGDTDKVVGGVAQAVQNFAPGSWIARLLLDDIVTYGTGSRPEGNFFERVIEGTEVLTK